MQSRRQAEEDEASGTSRTRAFASLASQTLSLVAVDDFVVVFVVPFVSALRNPPRLSPLRRA